ncbi:MAG: NUDIX domain-containing protein [Rhodospirillales bacterium]|nr:MAG: NUDIX domain-containing protein [Rhodospirillales bacterium]
MHKPFVTRQVAALAVRRRHDTVEVLMVTSRRRRRWVLPKGMIDVGLTARDSAAKEAWEEAGVTGIVGRRSIGRYRYGKSGRHGLMPCVVEVYPLRVTRVSPAWPEQRQRRRAWQLLDQVTDTASDGQLVHLLHRFAGRLGAVDARLPPGREDSGTHGRIEAPGRVGRRRRPAAVVRRKTARP